MLGRGDYSMGNCNMLRFVDKILPDSTTDERALADLLFLEVCEQVFPFLLSRFGEQLNNSLLSHKVPTLQGQLQHSSAKCMDILDKLLASYLQRSWPWY